MEPLKITFKVNKLDETAYFQGKNGDTYCSLVVWPNRDGEDKHGNTSIVKQDMGAERKGERTEIIGNGKPLRKRSAPPKNYEKLPTAAEMSDDDIPF